MKLNHEDNGMALIAVGLFSLIVGFFAPKIFGGFPTIDVLLSIVFILGGVSAFVLGWYLYAKFESKQGRLNRSKYFWRGLGIGFLTVFSILLFWPILKATTSSGIESFMIVTGIFLIFSSGVISMAFQVVMRLHDIGRPAIHYWLSLIPLYNIYFGFLVLLKKGMEGPNQYGKDPLAT